MPAGGTIRGAIAEIVRERGVDAGHDWFATLDDGQLLDMSQYNLFPNVTVLVFSDMLQVVRSRPGRDARRRVHGRVRSSSGSRRPTRARVRSRSTSSSHPTASSRSA